MYNVSKAPSKLVTQTRRGISQHLERLENRKESNKKSEELDQRLSAPKPVFHTNGYLKKNNPENQLSSSRKTITPQHAELIRYINDSWKSIYSQYQQYSPNSSDTKFISSTSQNVIYYDQQPCTSLQNFKPFDLEGWWSKRLYNTITKSL